MATGTLSPDPWLSVLDANGNPIAGAKVNTYAAGTTTPVTTYSDVALSVPNTNPIIADSAGRYLAFLTPGVSYKFIIQNPDSSAVRTQDNISAVPGGPQALDVSGTAGAAIAVNDVVYLSDGTGGRTNGSWYDAVASAAAFSTLPVIGFALTSAASAGQALSVRTGGRLTSYGGLTPGLTYYIHPSIPGAISSSPGLTFARTIGVADSSSSLVVDANPPPPLPFSFVLTQVAASTTGTVNDWSPGIAGPTIIRTAGNAPLIITGISAAGLQVGTQVILVNQGSTTSATVTLQSLNAGSAQGNRFYLQGGITVDTILQPPSVAGGTSAISLIYRGDVWVQQAQFAQGDDIPYTCTIGGSGGGQTIGNGALVATYALLQNGFRFAIALNFGTTTFSGITNVTFTLPFPVTSGYGFPMTCIDDSAGAVYHGLLVMDGAGTIAKAWVDNGTAGGALAALGGTIPITFASPDRIYIHGTVTLT